MRFPASLRVSVVASGLVAISAVLPIPVPASWIDAALSARSDQLSFHAERQWIRWGSGRITVEDLELRHAGRACARIELLEARLDLWPWSPGFGKPRRLTVHRPRLELDAAAAAALGALRSARARPMSTLLDVRDGSATWTDAEGRRWSVGSVRVLGHSAPAASRIRLTARARAPFRGSLEAAFAAADGLASWTLDARVAGESTPAWEELPVADWEWQGGPFAVHLQATGSNDSLTTLSADGDAHLASLSARGRDLSFSDVRARFAGSLDGGFRVDATAALRGAAVEAGGWVARDGADGPWWTRATVVADGARADADTVTWLRGLHEDVGEAVGALAPEGRARVRAGIGWRQDTGDVDWALHVAARELDLRYRGFLREDGERFSFPYPVTAASGEVAAGGAVIVYSGAGAAGGGRVRSRGAIDLRGDAPAIAVDVEAEDVPLDGDFGHALSGNPELARLWRRLGRPEGGDLDLEVRVRAGDEGVRTVVRGAATGAQAVPSDLPVAMEVQRASFAWRPGRTDFEARLAALGSRIEVHGSARGGAGGEPGLRFSARGEGLRCSPAERVAMESYLKLPRGVSAFDLRGDVSYALHFRRPPDGSPASTLAEWHSRDAVLAWPGMELAWRRCQADGMLAARGDRALLTMPRARGDLGEGRVEASVLLPPASGRARATVAGEGIGISTGLVARLRSLLQAGGWGTHLAWSGSADLRAEIDPRAPGDFRARLQLAPLLLADAGEPGRPRFTLSGSVHAEPGFFRSPRMRMQGSGFDYWLSEVEGRAEGGRLEVDGTLESVTGVRLSTQFPLIGDRDVVAAMERIRLDGTLIPKSVELHATVEEGAPPRLEGSGDVEVRGLTLDGPPSMREGQGVLRIEELHWSGPKDFGAALQLTGGAARMAGLAVDRARARITIDPHEIRWTEVEAAMLGGRVRSDFVPYGETETVSGEFALGLSPEAPVRMHFGFSGLQMDRMRRELGMGGSLGGVLRGHLDLSSPTPSPAGYRGRGYLRIERGALGTVPVLKNVWTVGGVDPPVFESGEAHLRANGVDRVVLQSFSLYHDLLEVTGHGFIRLDTHVRMIVTLQTFGMFGRLPLIEDLLGLVVEQDVRGPLERPVVLQRVIHKLSGREVERLPTPLWVPAPPQPDWDRSPIEPVGEGRR